jgi:hypothetical protein
MKIYDMDEERDALLTLFNQKGSFGHGIKSIILQDYGQIWKVNLM